MGERVSVPVPGYGGKCHRRADGEDFESAMSADHAKKIADAKRNASSSVILARAILGDAELARILSKYRGRPNTPEIRALMVRDVSDAMKAHMAATLSGGAAPPLKRPYALTSYLCRRVESLPDVIAGGPGAFMFDGAGDIVLHTPDGSVFAWNITRPDIEPFFHWNGNRDKPTLSPPLCITQDQPDGSVCELWQGRLLDGRLVPA